MRMSELLNEVRNFELDEGFSPKEIKMAIGIASDPRYAKGNMTGAVTAIERMKKGLSKHPQVMAVLKRQNEDFEEGYKPVKSNHFDVKIQGVKKKDVEAILKYIKQDGGNYDIEDVDDDQVRGGGSSGTSDGDIFIQGDDAGKLGMEIAQKFRGVKVMGEAVSPAQQAAIAISKKERGEKPKEEGNTFGKELKAARDKGEKTFVVSGKKYNVEDYDVDESKVEPSRIVEPYRPEFGLDEISTFSRAHIAILKKTFDPMRDKKLGPKGQAKLSKIMDMIGDKKDALIDLFKADIPFVSQSAAAKLITKYNMKGDEINKLKEEVELDEKYDLYHKDFSSAMQHAYSYAKSKMGITVDPKEIDSKVATGPKKPTEGKTNKYMLKGKGGNLQIQVYNKGGSKPFELNMYKEENELISQASKHISHMQMSERKVDPADVDDNASEKDVENAAKNIIMQLRKSVSMRGNKEVEFADIGHGYKKKVDMKIAQKALDMYNKMKPQDKTKFQTTIAKSYKDLLNAIKGK